MFTKSFWMVPMLIFVIFVWHKIGPHSQDGAK